MAYELWDSESANMLGSYAIAAAALQAVREAIRRAGAPAVLTWTLAREDRRGKTTTIARGRDLAARALAAPEALAGTS